MEARTVDKKSQALEVSSLHTASLRSRLEGWRGYTEGLTSMECCEHLIES